MNIRQSIRFRVYLYLGGFLLLVALLTAQSIRNVNHTSENLNELQLADAHQANSMQLRFQLMQLQNYVRVHRETGASRIQQRIDQLVEELQSTLNELIDSPSRTVEEIDLLERMSNHVQVYYEGYKLAAQDTSLRLSVISDSLLPEFSQQNEMLELAMVDNQSAERDSLERLVEASSILHDVRLSISEFLLRPDFGLVEQINRDLDRANELLLPLQNLVQLSDSILQVKQIFSRIVTSTRGYLILANVTMAGDANEFINLADELDALARDRQQQIFDASYRQALTLQNWAVLATIVISVLTALAIIGFDRIFISPVSSLTQVFQKLVAGEQVEAIPGSERQDEIGALANAADVFREKNRQTEKLLEQSSELVTELEVKNYQLEVEIVERTKAEHRLKQQSENLERSNQDLAQFAHVASHDLQEPLRMVSSYLQLISRRYKDKLDDDGVEFIDFAVDGARRMQSLIRSLLEYSRVETKGKGFVSVDCNQVVREVQENLRLSIEETNTEISCDELPTINADKDQLVRLFQNLISNAIRYRGESPAQIHIGCEARKYDFLFSVVDNGVGFDQQYANRIFVIFQRLHAREEYPESTGIGLSVCKRIVERHRGQIWANSVLGQGTTIFFTLPSGKRFG